MKKGLGLGPNFAEKVCPLDYKNAQLKYSMCVLARNFHFSNICTENYLKIKQKLGICKDDHFYILSDERLQVSVVQTVPYLL